LAAQLPAASDPNSSQIDCLVLAVGRIADASSRRGRMLKKFGSFACALAMGAALLPAAALADDPRDATMRNPAVRARDRAITRRMNQEQLAYVLQRDASSAHTYREPRSEGDEAYADARAEYGRELAAWRRAVAACNAGRWEYCDN